jgi:catalase
MATVAHRLTMSRTALAVPIQDPRYIERPRQSRNCSAAQPARRVRLLHTGRQPLRLMKTDEKEWLISNISGRLSEAPRYVQQRQLCRSFRADPAYGESVAKAMGISVDELVPTK